ncbi:hypothetical protein U27_01842 [Candidatus Vecturithrix granuli]|uniref:Uncharacterized protein n=1 Tax=Vecturithrix granuli TaxID=1499967 RepID=A0A0S6WA84_VECG1|nr:hypothetical protein U27_01842 [Candidatus Vecturithrix granuli]
MAEQHEKDQEHPEQDQKNPSEAELSRPRPSGEDEDAIQTGRERIVQRMTREAKRSRGIEDAGARPLPSNSEAIHHQEKRSQTNQPPLPQKTPGSIGVLEDRSSVKWAAWMALLISLVTLMLVSLYSTRKFGAEFQLRDVEMTQQKLVADVDMLKHDTHLEKIRIAILNAYFQLFARKDHVTAELTLTGAREELSRLIDTLPVEQSTEPKQILDSLEEIIREVRKGPSTLDERLKSVLLELEKISSNK